MIFVDTNVFMYAVGRRHPLREPARELFIESARPDAPPLCTSAEVLQELLHAYLPVGRTETLDAAFTLVQSRMAAVWCIEPEDVEAARDLATRENALGARDLLHLACCVRRGVRRLHTFDRALAAAAAAE